MCRPPWPLAGVNMFFERDGIRFHFRTAGDGIPFVYQHGLGADVNQPFKLFDPPEGFRKGDLITMDPTPEHAIPPGEVAA